MADTLVASQARDFVIGFGRPFCVIGERINPMGRKTLVQKMQRGDFSEVINDALLQVAAGAHVLDVHVGGVVGDPVTEEPALMQRVLEAVQSVVDVPLCLDSGSPEVLEAGLQVARGRPLVNFVTGEARKLEAILPLVARYKVPVVAIARDDSGISEDPDVRFLVAKNIIERAADYGIKASDVVVDPLVMPIGAVATAGVQVFRLVRRLREELHVNTTCGASNISFGIPNRRVLTGYFLAMAASYGMTSAIMNPLQSEDMNAVLAADVLNGIDRNCLSWMNKFREKSEKRDNLIRES